MTKQSFISEFLDNETINALTSFLEKESDFNKSANLIANAFGYSKDFSSMDEEAVSKLLVSFKNNITLLSQKTILVMLVEQFNTNCLITEID